MDVSVGCTVPRSREDLHTIDFNPVVTLVLYSRTDNPTQSKASQQQHKRTIGMQVLVFPTNPVSMIHLSPKSYYTIHSETKIPPSGLEQKKQHQASSFRMVSYKKARNRKRTAMNISKLCHVKQKMHPVYLEKPKRYNKGFSPIILIPFNAPPRCHMNSLKGE